MPTKLMNRTSRILLSAAFLACFVHFPVSAMELGGNFWNFGWHKSSDCFQDLKNVCGNNPWNPRFLAEIRICRSLRFMDCLPTICKLTGAAALESAQPDGEDVSDVWLGHPRPRRQLGSDRTAIFKQKDTNHDGVRSLEDYLRNFPDQAEGRRRFPTFDTNNDGVLSQEEFVSMGKR